MDGKIERRIVMHHEHDRLPGSLGRALRQMQAHYRLLGDRYAAEQPVRGPGISGQAGLSRQILVWGLGERCHDAHQTTGSSGVAKLCLPNCFSAQ
jgi:hypothetical protein